MPPFLLVGLGGFVGAVLRYWVSGLAQGLVASFPLGTLVVNFTGSLALSILMYLSEYKGVVTQETRVFLAVGVLGAFTTMSTFGFESFKLLEQNQVLMFAVNLFGTVALTIFAIYLGKVIAFSIWGN